MCPFIDQCSSATYTKYSNIWRILITWSCLVPSIISHSIPDAMHTSVRSTRSKRLVQVQHSSKFPGSSGAEFNLSPDIWGRRECHQQYHHWGIRSQGKNVVYWRWFAWSVDATNNLTLSVCRADGLVHCSMPSVGEINWEVESLFLNLGTSEEWEDYITAYAAHNRRYKSKMMLSKSINHNIVPCSRSMNRDRSWFVRGIQERKAL